MSYTNHHGLSRYIDDDNFTDDYDLINYNYDEYDGCITQQSETYIDGHANNDNMLKHVKRNIRRNRRKFLRACAYGSSDDIDRMAYSMRGQITIPWYLAFKTAVNTNTIIFTATCDQFAIALLQILTTYAKYFLCMTLTLRQ